MCRNRYRIITEINSHFYRLPHNCELWATSTYLLIFLNIKKRVLSEHWDRCGCCASCASCFSLYKRNRIRGLPSLLPSFFRHCVLDLKKKKKRRAVSAMVKLGLFMWLKPFRYFIRAEHRLHLRVISLPTSDSSRAWIAGLQCFAVYIFLLHTSNSNFRKKLLSQCQSHT